VHLRDPAGDKVIFLPTWWSSVLQKAASVLNRHHRDVRDIRFALEVDGQPRPLPADPFKRYYQNGRYSQHEAFFAGDTVGLNCVVPAAIDDDDFWRLMDAAGLYWGISPFQPGNFGFFKVKSLSRRGASPAEKEVEEENSLSVKK
jgi:hypothetical protein